MQDLIIEGTDDTPSIVLSKTRNIFEISGRSLPEDGVAFYEPVFSWLGNYAQVPNPSTNFSFKLDYFNTASSKIILDLLGALKDIKGIKVLWYAYEDDEEVRDYAVEFSEQVDIPIEIRNK